MNPNISQEMMKVGLTVQKGGEVIYTHRIFFCTPQQWENTNPQVEIPLNAIDKNGKRIRKTIIGTIGKTSGKYPGVLKITTVDRQAMEEKVNELEALLDEYGAKLNGHKHKYDAHLLSISADKFTTITTETVDICLNLQKFIQK